MTVFNNKINVHLNCTFSQSNTLDKYILHHLYEMVVQNSLLMVQWSCGEQIHKKCDLSLLFMTPLNSAVNLRMLSEQQHSSDIIFSMHDMTLFFRSLVLFFRIKQREWTHLVSLSRDHI